MPNKIFLNVRRKSIDEIFNTLIHELVHLQIENKIKKNNLSFEEKERIVEENVENIKN